MPKRITIINGHPDPEGGRFIHALARAYGEAASADGRELRRSEMRPGFATCMKEGKLPEKLLKGRSVQLS